MTLSKSDYLNYLKHPAWMWLKKHEKEKFASLEQDNAGVLSGGHLFESFVEKNYPEGYTIGFENYDEYKTQVDRTQAALKDPLITTLFQPRFEKDGLTCVSDIVIKVGDNCLDLYEIKASTKVDVLHEHDLAFQKYVIELSGYKVKNCKVILVNPEYVRMGEIDPMQLTVTEDITNAVDLLSEEIGVNILKALRVIHSPSCPDLNPALLQYAPLKAWLNIYRFFVDLPEDSIYDLTRLSLVQVKQFQEDKIFKIEQIKNPELLKNEQQYQVQAVKENRVIINQVKIKQFLEELKYPLYFLDYETAASVIPPFDKSKPYQQVPFQFSLHVLDRPGGILTQHDYLHKENSNPVEPLTQMLKNVIGENGTVLVWYEGFEKARNQEMGQMFPEFADFYQKLNERVVDLMLPFKNGWYIDRGFLGSASIKKVLPVLVPELSYKSLSIQEGGSAQRLWMETVLENQHEDEKDKIFSDLDAYCALDTLAMVKIYQKLLEI